MGTVTFVANHNVDLSEYTPGIEGTGGTITQGAAGAYVGGGGLIINSNGVVSTRVLAQAESVAGETELHTRYYFNPNNMTISDNNGTFYVSQHRYISTFLFGLHILKIGGVYQVRSEVKNDAFTSLYSTVYPLLSGWNLIEHVIKYASTAVANDGTSSIYVNNALQTPILSGIDMFDIQRPTVFKVGHTSRTDSGNITGEHYIDEVALSKGAGLIGPAFKQQWAARSNFIIGQLP